MTEPTREQLDNLLDHAHKRRLGPAEVDRIRAGFDALRQQLALSQAGASERETLLTEARDALEEHGGHGDAWPDIVAPIHALVAERDRLAADVHRARKLHHLDHLYEIDCTCPVPGDDDGDDDDGDVACLDRPVADICPTCIDEFGDPHPWPCETGTALDARPEPAADTDTARVTDHWPT